jgi:ribonuclease HI
VQWGQQEQPEPWEDVQRTVMELWVVDVAVTITAIWTWNVDRVHAEEGKESTLQEALASLGGAVREAYERYRLNLSPVTRNTIARIQVAAAIRKHWVRNEGPTDEGEQEREPRIGFCDGGSRGNPGPGGSGSVVVQLHLRTATWHPIWAAATVLGHARTPNNIAEFAGLHRILEHAAVRGWRYMHVVGDSAMILRLMRIRQPPKSKRLQHWYFKTARLVDNCRVVSWTHHYRKNNKMAD